MTRRQLARVDLPIDALLPEIRESLARRPNLVLRAETGAGKTTRVPPALLEMLEPGQQLWMLEPRRVAARAAARRIADEAGWTLGEEVGYHVRFDRCAGAKTRLLVMTEGIAVRKLQRDPFLEGVGIVIFDELHERNLVGDLALAMARRVQRDAREDLRLVAMSATLDAEPLVRFLGGSERCASIDSPGRLFPVEVEYLERDDARGLPTRVREAVLRSWAAPSPESSTPGDVLVFLPGVGEIRRCREFLEQPAREAGVEILSLYGNLPPAQQDAVLRPAPPGRRRTILSTNVAETSVTVSGVRTVVDSGLVRRSRFDPGLGLDRLELGRVSRASAEQRKGRAGREAPGRCLRLWTEHDHRSLPAYEAPEIARVDLAGVALELLAWGESDLGAFDWFEAPETATLERALATLHDLGAIERRNDPRAPRHDRLTDEGRALSRLPVHPRLAKILLEARRRGIPGRGALTAALLSDRDVVFRPVGRRPVVASHTTDSDIVDRVEALRAFDRSGYGDTALGPVEPRRARATLRLAKQLGRGGTREASSARAKTEPSASPAEDLRRALLAAYPERVCRRREAGSRRALMVGGRGVRLAEMSSVGSADHFIAVELDAGGREALVRQASAVEPEWLETRREDAVVFDTERQRAIGKRRTLYRDLVLQETEIDPGPQAATEALIEAAAADLEGALPLDDPSIAGFLARIQSLARWMPELDLPSLDRDTLVQLLPSLAAGRRSFADLRRAPLLDILRGSLGHETLSALDRHAPERLAVPSGRSHRLTYPTGRTEIDAPVLGVRIQELFGLDTTPTVADGRVPVLLHLLAPNGRPQQVTRDLPSFWRTTYPQVRKELAGRYSKHSWPEDPLTAKAESRPKRRR